MDISVIVPLYNEEESLPELFAWIKRVMEANHFSYEVIFVNDGSTDLSWQVIEHLAEEASSSVAITARALPCTVDSKRHREMWSSPWMPTCRTLPTRYLSSTA